MDMTAAAARAAQAADIVRTSTDPQTIQEAKETLREITREVVETYRYITGRK